MTREISRETLEQLKADSSEEAATLLKDYRRAVKCDEMVLVDEPDGSKSLLDFDEQGRVVTKPIKPR